MRFYILLSTFLLAGSVALIARFGFEVRTFFEICLLTATLAPEVVRKTPALYLRWCRTKFFVANAATTWELGARLEQMPAPPRLVSVAEELIRWAGEGSIISKLSNRLVLRLQHRFVVEVSVPNLLDAGLPAEIEIEQPHVDVNIHPVNVGYRDSRTFIDCELLPLLEKARELFGARQTIYNLKVQLPAHNPYIGLYMQSFLADRVGDMRIEFRTPKQLGGTEIVVWKDHLNVAGTSLDQFRRAIGAALTFSIPEV